MSDVVIIGYSGHAYVVCDILFNQNKKVIGYCEKEEKKLNPFNLQYLGPEHEYNFQKKQVFVAIGNNQIRTRLVRNLRTPSNLMNVIHQSAIVGYNVNLGKGILLAANVILNPLAKVGDGAICNTGCIIEHECQISSFAHIAPGAVLAGNVIVGERSFVGANSVVKQGITIGKDVVVGAGSVIINDIPDNAMVVGNPGRIIKYGSSV